MRPPGRRSFARWCGLVVAAATLGSSAAALATEYHLYPPGQITDYLYSLQPGDTLIVHSGTYNRIWMSQGVNGTPNAWITIKAAEGEPRPRIYYAGTDKNLWDIRMSSYLKIQGFEMTGGSDAFKFPNTTPISHHIVLEDLYIHHIGGGGINLSGIYEMYNLTVRNCEIAFTGGNGEGFYWGGHGKYWQPQVHDSLIENCYIHDLGGNQGDGIELKHGCYNNIIQDNVIIAQRGYPGITIWGTYKNDPAYNNIVRRNLVIASTDAAIHVTAETNIENNIVVNSISNGIYTRLRDYDGRQQYMRIVNNTIYNAGGDALELRNWDLGPDLLCANNAIYQSSSSKSAVYAPQGVSAATIANNIYYGMSNVSHPGFILGPPPASVFINASTALGVMDLYPKFGSVLIGAGDGTYAPSDAFDTFSRPVPGAVEVGAYEVYSDANPGWTLALGFKQRFQRHRGCLRRDYDGERLRDEPRRPGVDYGGRHQQRRRRRRLRRHYLGQQLRHERADPAAARSAEIDRGSASPEERRQTHEGLAHRKQASPVQSPRAAVFGSGCGQHAKCFRRDRFLEHQI